MKKFLTNLLIPSLSVLIVCIQPALANHPLLQNGWLKAATENSVTIATPKGGDMTFNLSDKTKIRFAGEDGTASDIQALAAQMGSQRIIINIRRDAPDSPNAVLVGLKVAKPAAAPPAAPASTPESTETTPEAASPSADEAPATE